MTLNIGISIIDIPLLTPVERYFAFAKEMGIRSAELVIGYKTYFSLETVRTFAWKYGVTIASVHEPVMFLFRGRYDERPFQIAARLGASYVAHPLFGKPLDGKDSEILFSWLSDMHKKYGVSVLVENMAHTVRAPLLGEYRANDDSASDLKLLLGICERYGFDFTLDTAHLAVSDPWQAKGFENILPYMANIHLSDFRGNDMQHLPLGTGELEYGSFLKQLIASDYSGNLIPEIFGYPGWRWAVGEVQHFQNLKDSIRQIRRYVAESRVQKIPTPRISPSFV